MDKHIYDLGILGGGAAGCMAAICAKRLNPALNIVIIEKDARILRRLLATGNGQCNFSNSDMGEHHYYGKEPGFVRTALTHLDVRQLLEFMEGLGIMGTELENGRIYPASMNAASMVDAFRFELEHLKITVQTSLKVQSVLKRKRFVLNTNGQQIECRRFIVAAGGAAAPALGGSPEAYNPLVSLGHHLIAPSPVLVQVCSEDSALHGLKGLKINADISFSVGKELLEHSFGELLFTDYGLSGPPIFYLSKYCHNHKNIDAHIDFFPQFSFSELTEILRKRRKTLAHLTLEDFLSGMMNKRISQVIMKRSGIAKLSPPVGDLSDKAVKSLAGALKDTCVPISGTNGFKNAQVAAGGIATVDFSPHTMESKLCPGLYAAGEVLDIFGDCGGYNLHWAFASGKLAGESAALSLSS